MAATIGLTIFGCSSQEAPNPSTGAATLQLTENLRIGDESAGDTFFLDSVYDVNVDSRGRIYVNELDLAGFRVFSSDGALIQEVGSEGEGPGEFSLVPQLRVGPRDSIYVLDSDNGRLTVFSPEHYELAYSLRLAEVYSGRPDDLLAVLQDGLIVEYDHTIARRHEDNPHAWLDIKLVDRSGQIVRDSLVRTPARELTLVDDEILSTIPFPREFGRRSHLAMGRDGLLFFGWSEDIGIRAATLDGAVAFEFTVPHVSVPVTSDEKDAESEFYPDDWRDPIRQDMPDTKPAYNAMVADDMGRLWLKLSWPAGAFDADWIVVDHHTGDVVAKTTLPIGAGVYVVRGDKAYGTMSEDVTTVIVWDISL